MKSRESVDGSLVHELLRLINEGAVYVERIMFWLVAVKFLYIRLRHHSWTVISQGPVARSYWIGGTVMFMGSAPSFLQGPMYLPVPYESGVRLQMRLLRQRMVQVNEVDPVKGKLVFRAE